MYISLDEFYKLGGIYASIHNNGEITEDEVSCLGDIIKSIEDRRREKNKKNRENMRRVRNSNVIDEEEKVEVAEVAEEEKVEVAEEVIEEEIIEEVIEEVIEEEPINPEDELSEEDVDLLDFLDSII